MSVWPRLSFAALFLYLSAHEGCAGETAALHAHNASITIGLHWRRPTRRPSSRPTCPHVARAASGRGQCSVALPSIQGEIKPPTKLYNVFLRFKAILNDPIAAPTRWCSQIEFCVSHVFPQSCDCSDEFLMSMCQPSLRKGGGDFRKGSKVRYGVSLSNKCQLYQAIATELQRRWPSYKTEACLPNQTYVHLER